MDRLRVKQGSPIHGYGLFADRSIPAGTRLIEYIGERITREQAKKRDVEGRIAGVTYVLEVNENLFIDAAFGGNESAFVNHSCDPNCEVEREGDRVWLCTKRDVRVNEELTIDYAYDPDDVKEVCRCGSPKCRGTINLPHDV